MYKNETSKPRPSSEGLHRNRCVFACSDCLLSHPPLPGSPRLTEPTTTPASCGLLLHWSPPALLPAQDPPPKNKASIWPTVRELRRQVQRVCPFLPILPRQGQVSHARPLFVYALLTHSIFRTHSTHTSLARSTRPFRDHHIPPTLPPYNPRPSIMVLPLYTRDSDLHAYSSPGPRHLGSV